MKRDISFLAAAFIVGMLSSCGNNSDKVETTTTTDSSSTMSTTADTGTANAGTANTSTFTSTRLNAMDSTFVMEAAMGGMMEVEAGRIAQQMAQSDRVKAFGEMMVRDHSNANTELKSLALAKGMMLPDSLPKKMQDHMTAMQKMTGASFDRHYIQMMNEDHVKDIAKFEKASKNCNDADLKAWATKTLPTLHTHKDSVSAIMKSKM